jgi:beta-N-acetylhexosaminidase
MAYVSAPRLSRRRALALATSGLAVMRTAAARGQETNIESLVAAMAPMEQAARMVMISVAGTSLTAADDARLRALKPGGVILVGENFGTPREVRALVAAIHDTNPALPPLVALDQEGGIVSRIGDDPAPDAPAMGLLSPAEVSALARLRAETLAGYGFDVNFAPVADAALTPDSFMAGRTFGAGPEGVAENVSAYLDGVAGTGVLHCVKHFPGHGRVSVDSHEALPILDVDPAVWWEVDALPFRVAIEVGVPMVMLGHLVVPMWGDLPASLSPEAVRVLRQDLGFGGVVVSDDLGMGALANWGALDIVDLAVAAGNDLLLFIIMQMAAETLVEHLAARVEGGEIAADRVASSVARILNMQRAAGG